MLLMMKAVKSMTIKITIWRWKRKILLR